MKLLFSCQLGNTYISVTKTDQMNIDKLLEILQRTNQPMGSSTGRAIYQSLLAGKVDEAKVIVFNDGDKLTQYPELEKWVIDNLGCR